VWLRKEQIQPPRKRAADDVVSFMKPVTSQDLEGIIDELQYPTGILDV